MTLEYFQYANARQVIRLFVGNVQMTTPYQNRDATSMQHRHTESLRSPGHRRRQHETHSDKTFKSTFRETHIQFVFNSYRTVNLHYNCVGAAAAVLQDRYKERKPFKGKYADIEKHHSTGETALIKI